MILRGSVSVQGDGKLRASASVAVVADFPPGSLVWVSINANRTGFFAYVIGPARPGSSGPGGRVKVRRRGGPLDGAVTNHVARNLILQSAGE